MPIYGRTLNALQTWIDENKKAQQAKLESAHYPAGYRPTQTIFLAERRDIQKKIKALKATGDFEGEALDALLARHDELLAKRHLAAKDERHRKAIRSDHSDLIKLLQQITDNPYNTTGPK